MKSYGQWCALAKALDVVGERWTLLIVRELLDGPRRYTDLRDGIPGIATDVLAARLRDLEHAGIVCRRTLPPPAASRVYELTERGLALEPVIGALARWGVQLLGDPQPDEEFHPRWLALGLRSIVPPSRMEGLDLLILFDLGRWAVPIRVRDGDFRPADIDAADARRDADAVVTVELGTLAAIAQGARTAADAVVEGDVVVEGTEAGVGGLARIFGTTVEHAAR